MGLLFSHSVVFDSFVTPLTIAHQSSLSVGFPRQEYGGGCHFPPESPAFRADSLPLSRQESLMNGAGAFIKEIPESSLSLSAI